MELVAHAVHCVLGRRLSELIYDKLVTIIAWLLGISHFFLSIWHQVIVLLLLEVVDHLDGRVKLL